MYRWSL